MKSKTSILALLLALLMCFSFNFSFAASDILVKATAENGNAYRISAELQEFAATDDLWIGTLAKWKSSGGKTHGTGTFFDNGEAIHNDDIIITNGVVGAVLAVGTRNPWGYPSGSILDAGTVVKTGGKFVANRDTIWSVEFLANGWDSWAPENCGQVAFDLAKYDFESKSESASGLDAVKVSRTYKIAGNDFDVVTYYGAAPGADFIYVFDSMNNNGGDTETLSNRFAVTNKGDDGGAMRAIDSKNAIGSYGMKTADTAFSTWYVLPGDNISNFGNSFAWSRSGGSVGYKELRANYSYTAGESVTYDAYLVISDKPDTAALDSFLNDYGAANPPQIPFADVSENSPYFAGVNELYSFGAVNGREDSLFGSDSAVTRAEFAAMIARLGYFDGSGAEASDISGHWAEEYIKGLIADGIMSVGDDNRFRPGESITLGEANSAIAKLFNVTEGDPVAGGALTRGQAAQMIAEHLDKTFTVSGSIAGSGSISKKSAVVLTQGNVPYGWAMVDGGNYSFEVPYGSYEYTVYLESDGLARGSSKGVEGFGGTVDLDKGKAKDKLTIKLADKSGNAIWGKAEILGEYPVVRFTGDSVFQASRKGVVNALVNDINDFEATIFGEGYYFNSDVVKLGSTDVKSGSANVEIDMQFATPKGWLSTDVHHHANKNDAFANPEDVLQSVLASGLDVAYVSDHDFTVNNSETYSLIKNSYHDIVGFIPSEEISCSWAHFNVVPQTSESYDYFLDASKANHIINQFLPFPSIVRQVHERGATITANHPWYSYGLFYAQSIDAVPGGYIDAYDMIELNACCSDSEIINTVNDATAFWTAYLTKGEHKNVKVEKIHYLVGASDTHDVLFPGISNNKGSTSIYHTGKARTYSFVGENRGDLKTNGLAVANAIRDGNSYASFGPILDPGSKIFGRTYKADNGVFKISIDIQSLNGVQDVLVLSNLGQEQYTYEGRDASGAEPEEFILENVLAAQSYNGENEVNFSYDADLGQADGAWFSVMVIDKSDFQMFAISNPYWVNK